MLSQLVFVALIGASLGFLETIFDRKVCYGDLGCFDTQTVRSLSRPLVVLPEEPSKINTKFFLYTRENADKSEEEELNRKDVSTLLGSHFSGNKPLKIIIHGFTHSAHQPWVQDMKKELLLNEDMNVIAVDWRAGAGLPYFQATANIRVVAAQLAKLVEMILSANPEMSASDIHMIGHSLGAHCAGEVGTRIRGISRISGLDPAEPYFEGGKEVTRLEPRDADFVDIIHSDGSAFLGSFGMGYRTSTGHVDFYPNGGGDQPGCAKSTVSKIISSAASGLKDGAAGLTSTFACSHDRAIYYFTESINSKCPFTAYHCDSYDDFKKAKCLDCSGGSCSTLGYHAIESSARGDFYLMTNQQGNSPQCSYHYRVSVKAGTMTNKGYGKVGVTLIDSTGQTFGPVNMTDKDVNLETNTELSRLIIAPASLGEIVNVKVTYHKSNCATCFLYGYSDFFRLQKVQVTEGERQKQVTFCGKNTSVAKDQFRVIKAEMVQSAC